MRRSLSFIGLNLFAVGLAPLVAPAGAAEATRTLRAQLSGADVARFGVENLAGAMKVAPGKGEAVVAVATVHAESDALAGAVRFERVVGKHGEPVLRVLYPEGERDFRYPAAGHEGSSDTEYDGHRVRVSGSRGALVYADVEVQVPAKLADAAFRNAVGPLAAADVSGKLAFDTASGDVRLDRVSGDVVADTGSGDVTAQGAGGSLACDTGSGDCDVAGFRGQRVSCDTGSGDVRVEASEAEEIAADTGSGRVDVEAAGARLARIKADTGSGDVRLRLPSDASFSARADLGSGRVRTTFADAQAIVDDGEVVGYRRGDGRIRIDVDTGSGDLVLEPR